MRAVKLKCIQQVNNTAQCLDTSKAVQERERQWYSEFKRTVVTWLI